MKKNSSKCQNQGILFLIWLRFLFYNLSSQPHGCPLKEADLETVKVVNFATKWLNLYPHTVVHWRFWKKKQANVPSSVVNLTFFPLKNFGENTKDLTLLCVSKKDCTVATIVPSPLPGCHLKTCLLIVWRFFREFQGSGFAGKMSISGNFPSVLRKFLSLGGNFFGNVLATKVKSVQKCAPLKKLSALKK